MHTIYEGPKQDAYMSQSVKFTTLHMIFGVTNSNCLAQY